MLGAEISLGRAATARSDDSLRDVLLLAIFVTYPFHQVMEIGIQANVSYADPLIAVVVLLWIAGTFGAVGLPRYAPLVALIAALAGFSLGFHAVDPSPYFSLDAGLVKLVKLAGSVAWFVAVFVLVRRNPSRYVATAAAVSVAAATAFVLLALYEAAALEAHRQSGPFQNPNLFGNYLLFNACLGCYVREAWPVDRWPWLDRAVLAAVGVVAAGILVTGSRGSLIGLGLAGAVILVTAVEPSRRAGLLTAGAGAVTALASAVVVWLTAPSLAGRFLSTRNVQGRLDLWSLGLDAFASSPVVGIGYGQFTQYHVARGGPEIGVHNTYLLVAAELGFVGFVLFAFLLGVVLRDALEAARDAPEVAFLLAFLVGTAGQALVTDVDNFRSLWIAFGAIAAYQADRYGRVYRPLARFDDAGGRDER